MPPKPPAGHVARIAVGTPPLPTAASTAKTLTGGHAQRNEEMLMQLEIVPQLQVEGFRCPSHGDPDHLHTGRKRGGGARGGYGEGGGQGGVGGGDGLGVGWVRFPAPRWLAGRQPKLEARPHG